MQIGTFHVHKGLVIIAAVFGVVLSIFLQKSSLKDIPLEPASFHSLTHTTFSVPAVRCRHCP
jgi:hypothetical protein